MRRVAILIDGSNFLAQLEDCDLGYPALKPLIARLQGSDELAYARFYGAPPQMREYQARWQAFRDANRHILGLDWFQGYRNIDGQEKAIDVALAVDLIYGCKTNHFDASRYDTASSNCTIRRISQSAQSTAPHSGDSAGAASGVIPRSACAQRATSGDGASPAQRSARGHADP